MRRQALQIGVLCTLSVAAASACATIVGDFEFKNTGSTGGGSSTSSSSGTGGSTSSSSSSSSTTGGAACVDATHTCLEEPPAGWAGPVVLYQGNPASAAPSCALSPYPTQVADYHGTLDAGNPTCGCTCAAATGIVCSASSSACYLSGMCGGGCLLADTTELPPNQCVALPTNANPKLIFGDPAPTQAGSCAPQPTKSIPTPTWGIAARACTGAATTAVGCAAGEICAPLGGATFDSLCVVQLGDVACPDAFYATKNTLYDSFADTRDCSACMCDLAASGCGGTVTLSKGSGGPCTVSPTLEGTYDAGTCATYAVGGDSALYVPTPSGTCPPLGGAPIGMASPTGATTICCH